MLSISKRDVFNQVLCNVTQFNCNCKSFLPLNLPPSLPPSLLPQELGLQPEDNFVLKVVQLEELIHVRHSVFVIGNPGTGKTKILRSLNRTYQNMKRRPMWHDLNPKAVTNDELFGYINPATREWKDGEIL